MTCPRCGLRNPKTAKVCGRCGETLTPAPARLAVDSHPGKPKRAVQLSLDEKLEAKSARRKSNPPRRTATDEPAWAEEIRKPARRATKSEPGTKTSRAAKATSKPPAKRRSKPPLEAVVEQAPPPVALAEAVGVAEATPPAAPEPAMAAAPEPVAEPVAGTAAVATEPAAVPATAAAAAALETYVRDTDPDAAPAAVAEPPALPPLAAPRPVRDTQPERTQPPGPPTPEQLAAAAEAGAPLRAHLAGVLRRAGAWAVDGAILFALFLTYLAVGIWAGDPRTPSSEQGIDWIADSLIIYGDLVVPGVALAAVAAFVYFSVFHALGGSTPGKRLLGLRVIYEDGSPLRLPEAALRTASSFLSLGLFLMGLVLVLFDRRGQALHDKLLRTYVVRDVL